MLDVSSVCLMCVEWGSLELLRMFNYSGRLFCTCSKTKNVIAFTGTALTIVVANPLKKPFTPSLASILCMHFQVLSGVLFWHACILVFTTSIGYTGPQTTRPETLPAKRIPIVVGYSPFGV